MNELSTDVLTVEKLVKAFPKRKPAITQELVDIINGTLSDPEFQTNTLLDTLKSHEQLLTKNNGTGFIDLIHATKFCAYLVSVDFNSTEAYKRTFAHRDFVKTRMYAETSSKEYKALSSAATRYRGSPLVNDILNYSQASMEMFFMGERYRAVGVLVKEMHEAPHAKDRIAAADKLLLHTKGPDNLKIALDVGVKENSAIEQLNTQLASLAARGKALFESGAASLEDYGSMAIDVDYVEVGSDA